MFHVWWYILYMTDAILGQKQTSYRSTIIKLEIMKSSRFNLKYTVIGIDHMLSNVKWIISMEGNYNVNNMRKQWKMANVWTLTSGLLNVNIVWTGQCNKNPPMKNMATPNTPLPPSPPRRRDVDCYKSGVFHSILASLDSTRPPDHCLATSSLTAHQHRTVMVTITSTYGNYQDCLTDKFCVVWICFSHNNCSSFFIVTHSFRIT